MDIYAVLSVVGLFVAIIMSVFPLFFPNILEYYKKHKKKGIK